jgi:uncharacterized protein (TIGR03435 family)
MMRAVAGRSSFRGFALLLVLSALPATALAQADASGASFDAASVKVSPALPQGVVMFRLGSLPESTDPGRIDYKGVTIKQLVARAYNVKDYQVEGPQWLDGEHYDVIATIPQGSTKEQVSLMLQRLLAERFKLTLHHESKPMAVYTLLVAKGGAKLTEIDPEKLPPAPVPGSAPPPPPPPGPGGSMPRGPMPAGAIRIQMSPNSRHMVGNGTIQRLCNMLSNMTDRPVIDLTELKGTYEFDLQWAPDENEKMGKVGSGMVLAQAVAPPGTGASGNDSASDPLPTLVQALQTTFGLKLEAKKNPAEFLVVDHAEKVPTEN